MSPTPSRFRLVIFDWDGTVMDSAATIVACMRTSLADLDIPPLGDDRLRSTIGLGLDAVLANLLPDASPELRGRVVERYRHHWLSTYYDKPIPFEGIGEALEQLQRRGHVMAVATGKGRAGLDRDLAQCDLQRFFAATRTVNECASKPAPHMVLEILDELGCTAEEALVIGDTTYDLDMARNAGVASIAVLCGAHDRGTLLGSEPIAVLDAARQLPDWLAENS